MSTDTTAAGEVLTPGQALFEEFGKLFPGKASPWSAASDETKGFYEKYAQAAIAAHSSALPGVTDGPSDEDVVTVLPNTGELMMAIGSVDAAVDSTKLRRLHDLFEMYAERNLGNLRDYHAAELAKLAGEVEAFSLQLQESQERNQSLQHERDDARNKLQLRAEITDQKISDLEGVLRELACSLSVGGYNADRVDPEVFRKKISDGIDLLTQPLVAQIQALTLQRDEAVKKATTSHREYGEVYEELERAEEALRSICILCGYDPSDGEGTSPDRVVESVKWKLANRDDGQPAPSPAAGEERDCPQCCGHGTEEIQSGPYERACSACGGSKKRKAPVQDSLTVEPVVRNSRTTEPASVDAPTPLTAAVEERHLCGCQVCLEAREAGLELCLRSGRMVVCGICGNKRCPHATDHGQACTGSNESGQPGSVWGPAKAVLEAREGSEAV
ncbi:MAG: hypothetical protein JWO08_2355 [Verrucomicrobiaceae bacterium]|nr:hypothetical protein [Verrucomicrobiaceae bacterium]